MKVHADTQFKAKPSSINVGDLVLVRQRKENKLSTHFNPSPFCVTSKKGAKIIVCQNGKHITRNTSHFKLINPESKEMTDDEEQDDESTDGE